MNEMHRLVFEKGMCFAGKFRTPPTFGYVQKVCDALTFSINLILERCSADGKLLIETMVAGIEKVVLK